MHRLGDEHGDLLGSGEVDGLLRLLEHCARESLRVARGGVAVGVGIGQEGDGHSHGLEGRSAVGQTREAQRTHRCAVVGELACDRLGALRLAVGRVPLAHEFPCRLHRLAAAIGEVRALHAEGGCQVDERFGEFCGCRVREIPRGRERQNLQLPRGGGSHLCAVRVAEVGAEEPGEPIDEAAPVVADDLTALAPDDHLGTGFGVPAHVGEVEEQVVSGLLADGPSAGALTLGSVHGSHIP